VGLSRLWGLRASRESLAEIAARLGSDVPFLLVGGTAYGWGRGERLVPLAPLPETPVLLGVPPFGIETAEVYRRLAGKPIPGGPGLPGEALTPPEGGVTVPALFHKLAEKKDFGLVRNDLEPVVLEGWPSLAAFREAVAASGAAAACVSGSGSTVFGVFGTGGEAERAAADLRGRFAGWTLVVARTVSHGVRVDGPDRGDAAGSGG
jgi:4-diphosphocytidyl-2-C-methyl-D-erythritol kinase